MSDSIHVSPLLTAGKAPLLVRFVSLDGLEKFELAADVIADPHKLQPRIVRQLKTPSASRQYVVERVNKFPTWRQRVYLFAEFEYRRVVGYSGMSRVAVYREDES